MCAISGIINLDLQPIDHLPKKIDVMNNLQRHRGPDGEGVWVTDKHSVGLGHRRLSILDLNSGAQPMRDPGGNVLIFNGEIYNYIELKKQLSGYDFKTTSDTEVILASYLKWGENCVNKFRGMFSFALWDAREQKLLCARDHFGIKPFYYLTESNTFYFASECKALMPFVGEIKTNLNVLKEYLTFQLSLSEATLFQNINQLAPAHYLTVKNGHVAVKKYWEVQYEADHSHSEEYFKDKLNELLNKSVKIHLRSDVPVGSYLSGGLDSSIVTSLARKNTALDILTFTGKFSTEGKDFDESYYANLLASELSLKNHQRNINSTDFVKYFDKLMYALDYPQAGPGAFAQYCVSESVANHRKVVLGGQGADEIFGGYTRYLVAYFEQCIKGAIDGTLHDGQFLVTYESIIDNLNSLKNYKPMIKDFFSKGLFESLDKRYFQLISRNPRLNSYINWDLFSDYNPYDTYYKIFNGSNVKPESFFDKMSHFDFKILLPGLLQVEDRVSMAWGIETRVPFVDKEIVEFAATVPANVKFKNGQLKRLLIEASKEYLPKEIIDRKDKMGFPVPLNLWIKSDLRDYIQDTLGAQKSKARKYFNASAALENLKETSAFSRNFWGLLSLEVWHQQFHDKEIFFKKMVNFDG